MSPALRSDDLRHRGRLLFVVLSALQLGASPLLRAWLDSWPGLGLIVAGMARQGFDLELTRSGGNIVKESLQVTVERGPEKLAVSRLRVRRGRHVSC